jgi:hypothetical protein
MAMIEPSGELTVKLISPKERLGQSILKPY